MSILLIGEALLNEIVTPDGASTRTPGGAMVNVGLGLKNLGRTVRIVTDLGLDPEGEIIAEYAADRGIELWLRADEERTNPTSVSRVSLDSSGSANYVSSFTWDIQDKPFSAACQLDLQLLDPKSTAFGSAGCFIEPGASKIRNWLEAVRDSTTIFYDPNIRPHLFDEDIDVRGAVEDFASYADVVKCSTKDIARIYGPGVSADDAAARLRELGPSLVVITAGAGGSIMYSGHLSPVYVPASDAKPVDTTGAGDTFFAALIDGLTRLSLSGAQNREHLAAMPKMHLESLGAYAAAAASITVSRRGVNPPTREELAAINDSYRAPGF